MRIPVSCTVLYTRLYTLYSKKMMQLIGIKKPLPLAGQRPEFTFTEKIVLLAACLGESTRSPTAAYSQTCQSQKRKRSRGRLGDSGGYH